jgi:hypothetical protein
MPGLLTLNTDLKSLKYGQDQPNGGSSNEPYIKVDINSVDATFNKVRLTKFDDGLVRGGAVGAINASVVDTLRIGKFFTNFPKGPLFLVKQVGLQLSNPRLEHKTDLPTNQTGTNRPTKGQGLFRNIGNVVTNAATNIGAFISNTANRAENEVGPTRIYNLGINTLAQIPLNAVGGHIVRHGFLPTEDPSKYYEAVVTQNNFQNDHNRLEQYASNFGLGGMDTILDKQEYNTDTLITSYIGGPSSVYGIGQTFIRRWTNTNDKSKIEFAKNQSKDFAGKTRNDTGGPESLQMEYRFKGASNFSSSIYASGSFNALGDPLGLDDRNATSNINEDKTGIYHWNAKSPVASIKIKETADYGVSKEIKSSLSENGFDDLPSKIENSNQSFIYNTASINDKLNPHRLFLTSSRIIDTVDYGISLLTSSTFAPKSFTDLPSKIENSNISFIYKLASNSDIEDSKNKSQLSLSNVSNNLATASTNGPSTYPEVQSIGVFNPNQLSLPNLAYTNPSSKTYTAIQQKNQSYISSKQQNILTNNNDRTSPSYTYNTGTPLVFNRTNDLLEDSDEMRIIFTPIDPFSAGNLDTLVFLAYLTDYSDTFDSSWNDVKYVGRAEKFYIFNEFKRSISFGFNIPCFNPSNLAVQHTKLNNLASILAGTYNNGLLGGIITKLKLGNYVDNEPGIITSLNFSPIQDSSWDLDNLLAFYIKVTVSFTLIHDMLPKYGAKFINSNNKMKSINSESLTPAPLTTTNPTTTDNTTQPTIPNGVPFGNLTLTPTTTYNTVASYNAPSPITPGNYYNYDGNGNIDAELNIDGTLVRTINPPQSPSSLLNK